TAANCGPSATPNTNAAPITTAACGATARPASTTPASTVATTKVVSGRIGSGQRAVATVASRAPTASTDSSDAPRAVLPKCSAPSSGQATMNMPNPTNAITDASVTRRRPGIDTIAPAPARSATSTEVSRRPRAGAGSVAATGTASASRTIAPATAQPAPTSPATAAANPGPVNPPKLYVAASRDCARRNRAAGTTSPSWAVHPPVSAGASRPAATAVAITTAVGTRPRVTDTTASPPA